MAYDFSILNDKDFEELSRDILNAKFGLDLQSFRTGKDGGIDLRFSTSINRNYCLVQAKHYYYSGYSALKSKIQVELSKLHKLKPHEYWLTTSVSLSPKNKDELSEILSPYLKSPNFILGLDDIKKYLFEFPKIEEKWYKLWMTSSNVLKLIVNNAIHGRSQFYEEKIKSKIKLYVKNKNFNIALDILKENHFILITGQPGVGKTTLANLITYYFLSEGYSLVYIDGSIREAEDAFSNDANVKQIFYFDDFLGSNYYEIRNPKSSETGLVLFLERICSSQNKFLILTSRTTIYKTALTHYEKLGYSKIDFVKKEIELVDYNTIDKAEILYNHIYHSQLPVEYRKEIFKDKNYWRIINHKNYTPRIIEFFCDYKKLSKVEEKEFMQYILTKLDNPEDIWRFAFFEQINEEDRILIQTISTFPNPVPVHQLQSAYEHRLSVERKASNLQATHDSFNSSIKRLLDGFVKAEMSVETKQIIVSFINPSVNDFLINYLAKSSSEKWSVIKACIYSEQIRSVALSQYLNQSKKNSLDKDDLQRFNVFIKDNYSRFSSRQDDVNNRVAYAEFMLLSTLSDLMDFHELYDSNDEFIYMCLVNKEFDQVDTYSFPYLYNILKYVKHGGKTESFVKENWDKVVKVLFSTALTESEFIGIINLFDTYDQSYLEFLGNKENKDLVKSVTSKYSENGTYDFMKNRRKLDLDEFEHFDGIDQGNVNNISINPAGQIQKSTLRQFTPTPSVEKLEQYERPIKAEIGDLWTKINRETLDSIEDYIDNLFS